jgi:hypothetical protein
MPNWEVEVQDLDVEDAISLRCPRCLSAAICTIPPHDHFPAVAVPHYHTSLHSSFISLVFLCLSLRSGFEDRSCIRPLRGKQVSQMFTPRASDGAVACVEWTIHPEPKREDHTSHHRIGTGIDSIGDNQTSNHKRPHWLGYRSVDQCLS